LFTVYKAKKLVKLANTFLTFGDIQTFVFSRLGSNCRVWLDIDTDPFGIPDTEYDARITMPAAKLTRIVR